MKFEIMKRKNEIVREWTSRKKYKIFFEIKKDGAIFISENYSFFAPTRDLNTLEKSWVITEDWYILKSIEYAIWKIDLKRLFKKEWNWKYYFNLEKKWVNTYLTLYKLNNNYGVIKELYWEYKK